MVHEDPDDEDGFFNYMVSDLDLQSFIAKPTDTTYPLSVDIVGTDVGNGRLHRQHTTYIIHVDDCGKIFEKRRRYKEFKWLHKDLVRRGLVQAQGVSNDGMTEPPRIPSMTETPSLPSTTSRLSHTTTSTTTSFTRRMTAISTFFSNDEGALLANLPPKKRFGNKRSDFVEKRQGLLENYLRSLLEVEAVVKDKEIWRFLGVDSSTAVVVRFTRFPITADNAMDKLEKLERIAGEELNLFRLCSRPVVWTLVRFARQVCRLPLQADAARHLARICKIMRKILSHSYGRAGLIEAGGVSVLVAAMRRAVEDPSEAIKAGCAPAPADVRKAVLHEAMTSTQRLMEDTRGSGNSAFIHFIEEEDGLLEIKHLAAAVAPRPLRKAASMIIWAGLEDESTALLFFREEIPDSTSSMPPLWVILTDLLRSSDICTSTLAAASVAQLARHRLSPLRSGKEFGRVEFEECLKVVTSIHGRFDSIVSDAEATSVCEGIDVKVPLLEVLTLMCNAKGIPRFSQMLESSGNQIDAVTGFVTAVVEKFVVLHQKKESVLASVTSLALQLQQILENAKTHPDEHGAKYGDVVTRISRVLLHINTSPDVMDSASMENFKLRMEGLMTLYQDVDARTSATSSRFESLVASATEKRDTIEIQGLLERLCVKGADTTVMCKQISSLELERKNLSVIRQHAEDLMRSAAHCLDESKTVYTTLESSKSELSKRIEALSPNEVELQEAEAALEVSKLRAQEDSRALEVEQEAMRQADTCVQSAGRADSDARKRALEAQQAEITAGNACANAPAELDSIREQLADNEARQAKIVADANKLDVKKTECEKHMEALTQGLAQTRNVLGEIELVLEELRELRRQHNGSTTPRGCSSDSEDDTSECGECELLQLESRLRSHRPERLTWPSDWGGGLSGPSDAPDWESIFKEKPLEEGATKVAPSFRSIGRYSAELQQLWNQERVWLDGETEKAKRTLRSITKTTEVNVTKSRENEAKAIQLRLKAAEFQDVEALAAKHAQARSLAEKTAEEVASTKEKLVESERVSRLATERFSLAHARLQDAEAAVSNADGQVWAAKSRSSKARAALGSWTHDFEKRSCDHLKVLQDDSVHLCEVGMANRRAGEALRGEAAVRQDVRKRAQDLIKKLQDLDQQLSAETLDRSCMDPIQE